MQNLSGDCSTTYTPDELGIKLHLDDQVVEYLKKEPLPENDPLICLDFKEAFSNLGHFETNKATVYRNLSQFGGVQVKGNVFKFDDWRIVYEARDGMLSAIPWAFYSAPNVVVTANQIQLSQQPTIQTIAITQFSEPPSRSNFMIQDYELFKI